MDELDRLFQEELAALERAKQRDETPPADEPLGVRQEFERLRRARGWTVSDVLGFFPHEESVSYLASLISRAPSAPEAPAAARKAPGDAA